jgi:hypothetical protein
MGSVQQSSFTRGEISPNLYSRVDLALLQSGLKLCLNWITEPFGGVVNRSGTRFVAEVKNSSAATRLMPFRFNATQSYVLEAGNNYFRIFYAGGGLLEAYSALPAYSNVTPYYGGSLVKSGSLPYRSLLDNNLNHAPASNPTWWQLLDVVVVGGVPYVSVEVPSPFVTAELPDLVSTQFADTMTITSGVHPPMDFVRRGATQWRLVEQVIETGPFEELNLDKSISILADKLIGSVTLRASAAVFDATKHVGRLIYLEQRNETKPWEVSVSVTADEIRRNAGKYYSALDAGTTGAVPPTHFADVSNDGGVDWLYLHSGYGIARVTEVTSSTQASATVLQRLPSNLVGSTGFGTTIDTTHPAPSPGPVTLTASATTDGFLKLTRSEAHGLVAGLTGSALLTFDTYRIITPGPNPGDPDLTSNTGSFNINVTSTTEIVFTDLAYADLGGVYGNVVSIAPPGTGVATDRWKFGAWSAQTGYPKLVTFHQGRRIYANTDTHPNTYWTTRSNAYLDFSVTAPHQDDDAITETLVSAQMNEIRGLVPLDKLAVLTAGAQWVRDMTPGVTGAKEQGSQGSAKLVPLSVGDVALFLQDKGRVVRNLDFDFSRDKYVGIDLTKSANHLFKGHSIVSWDYQQDPFGIVWMVREDGLLIGMTYMKEESVIGFHRHDLGGAVESVCCVSEIYNGVLEDGVYLLVKRTIGGVVKRFIERMNTRLVTDFREGFFVDCGLTYDGRVKVIGNSMAPDLDLTATTLTLTGGTLWNETEVLTATLSDGVFNSSVVGNFLAYDDAATKLRYFLEVLVRTSSSVLSVRPSSTIPPTFRSARTDWAYARKSFAGMGHLEGETINVLADGLSVMGLTVVSGGFSLDNPAVLVHAGKPIVADLQTLALANPQGETLSDKKMAIHTVRAQTLESQSLFMGRTFNTLKENKIPSVSASATIIELENGLVEIPIPTPWAKDGSVCIRHTRPTPIEITSLIPEVNLGSV